MQSVDPGLIKVNVCSESIRVVGEYRLLTTGGHRSRTDVKIQLTSVPRQTVQTKDNVSVEVDR